MDLDYLQIESAIESILFVYSDPISIQEISDILDISLDVCCGAVENIKNRCEFPERGIYIIKLQDKIQMVSKEENASYIKDLLSIKNNSSLSSAAFEVLSIIAYNQPVTKNFIEKVRGIESYGILNNLLKKDLIEEAGRLDIPGKPISYRTSLKFLRCFGLENLEDLPKIPENNVLQNENLNV